jgi:Arc/MetJ family transcription regulator
VVQYPLRFPERNRNFDVSGRTGNAHHLMLYPVPRILENPIMRTTLALDDNLLAKAQAFTGLTEKTALVREALKALIERESARRLARLGGTEPELAIASRRRPDPA